MKKSNGYTLLEVLVVAFIIIIIGAGVIGALSGNSAVHETPLFETDEQKRNRMLERQAEAMERQNEIAEKALEMKKEAERNN